MHNRQFVETSSPYTILQQAGISSQSTHEQVLDGALDLQSQGLFTDVMRQAWDRLRMPSERLATDYFLVAASHPSSHDRALEVIRRVLDDSTRKSNPGG